MMSKNSSRFIALWLLVQWLVKVNCQVVQVVPVPRSFHTATFINDKLYVLGGQGDAGNQSYYIDMSISFNVLGTLWNDLTPVNKVPSHFAAAAVKAGVNNDTLFLYGGVTTDPLMALVYAFDVNTEEWSTPEIKKDFGRKDSLTGISYDGKMYLFGGLSNGTNTNEMFIFDTIKFGFTKGSLIKAPIQRRNYAATLFNQKIVYLGGILDDLLPLNEIHFYDIIDDSWSTETIKGDVVPSNRESFSAVLGLDGQRIIIFGGYELTKIVSPEDSLYVLNLTDLTNIQWYVPNIRGTKPNGRLRHQANVVGKYMVVSFGDFGTRENDLLLLDISNDEEYVWASSFDPSPPPKITTTQPSSPSSTSSTSSETPSPSSTSNNTSVIIGSVIGALIGGVALLFGSFFLYRLNNKRRPIPTPGGNGV